jgi:hypothetical protein
VLYKNNVPLIDFSIFPYEIRKKITTVQLAKQFLAHELITNQAMSPDNLNEVTQNTLRNAIINDIAKHDKDLEIIYLSRDEAENLIISKENTTGASLPVCLNKKTGKLFQFAIDFGLDHTYDRIDFQRQMINEYMHNEFTPENMPELALV